jgi:hypothetical protein
MVSEGERPRVSEAKKRAGDGNSPLPHHSSPPKGWRLGIIKIGNIVSIRSPCTRVNHMMLAAALLIVAIKKVTILNIMRVSVTADEF